VGRNLAAFADTGVFLDLDEGADFRLVADLAPVKVDERGLRDPHILSQLDIRQTHLFLDREWSAVFFVRQV
jgi:hypothetical protein